MAMTKEVRAKKAAKKKAAQKKTVTKKQAASTVANKNVRTLFGHPTVLQDSAGYKLPKTHKFKIISDKLIGLDHKMVDYLAATFPALEIRGIRIDRPLNLFAARDLAMEMMKNTFLWERVCFSTAVYMGQEFRINGQTTLTARKMIEDPLAAPNIRWIRYQVDSEAELRELYSVIDHFRVRTYLDVLRAMLVGTNEFPTVTLKTLSKISSGLNLWGNPGRNGRSKGCRLSTGDRARMMLSSHYDIVCWILRVMGTKNNVYTWRPPVIAALFEVFSHEKYRREGREFRFWCSVVAGADFKKNSAQHLLYTYLSTHGMTTDQTKQKNPVRAETILRVCLAYFEAWKNGGPLDSIENQENTGFRPTIT